MTTYTHTLDLESFYNGDFKTDKEILVLTPYLPVESYSTLCLQACILNPKCASVIANSRELANTIVEKWMPERSDKYPYVLSCKVYNWLIEKHQNEEQFSFMGDVSITSIDIYKHLNGETPIVDEYYVFTHDPGRFRTDDSVPTDVMINSVKTFLSKDIKRITAPNAVNIG